ncbi:MAG: PhoH family protein [Candidatus Marinimicrobia bacterium]|nr:PhoH family protein [Candidatus Neomarinimicrobiota bacterium]
MIKKTIDLHDVDRAAVFGVGDRNLKILERKLSVELSARGSKLTVAGLDYNVIKLEAVVKDIILAIKHKGHISENDVETLVDMEVYGDQQSGKIGSNTAIVFKKNGVIKPKTPVQERYFKSTQENDIVFAIGPAGTGKTYLAVAIAVAAWRNNLVERLILTRPAVETGESLGFLPGDLKEKIQPYLAPLNDALFEMLTPEKHQKMYEQGIIEILPLAYMRGRTLNNAFVILDEAQNTTSTQMKMFLTRLGVNSKAIITGDTTQIDIPKKTKSGLVEAEKILKNINGIDFIYFSENDVVRHRLVKEIISAYNQTYEQRD